MPDIRLNAIRHSYRLLQASIAKKDGKAIPDAIVVQMVVGFVYQQA